jgi:hypothetical protein
MLSIDKEGELSRVRDEASTRTGFFVGKLPMQFFPIAERGSREALRRAFHR